MGNNKFRLASNAVTTNVTEQVASFASGLKYEDLPREVVERAKMIILLTIGAAVSAKGLPASDNACNMGKNMGGGELNATLWSDGSKISMAGAAFANGMLSDLMDWEDCSWTGHPSSGVVPAAWAVGEGLRRGGKDVITAVVAGYEIYQRAAMVVQPPAYWGARGWGLTSWQIWGSVAAAAKLYNLDAEKMNQAMGFGATCCSIPGRLHHITLSDAYHNEFGFRAMDGVMAAMITDLGICNFMDVLDDPYSHHAHMTVEPRPEWYTRDLGKWWLIMETLIKHWPTNMWIELPMDAFAAVVTENDIKAEQVESIVIDPPPKNRMYYDPDGYSSLVHAQYSVPFMYAAYLLNHEPGRDWYERSRLNNPELLALAARVRPGVLEPLDLSKAFRDFQKGEFDGISVTVHTKDGRSFTKEQALPLGHPGNMLTREDAFEQFRTQMIPAYAGKKVEQAFEALMSLEDCEDINELSKFLY
ncbi:MAG: MmgE/PrpD family protein [Clostridia bacterium]|nr:MmgE/PrpD family protein [Clostridia bacterium]